MCRELTWTQSWSNGLLLGGGSRVACERNSGVRGDLEVFGSLYILQPPTPTPSK